MKELIRAVLEGDIEARFDLIEEGRKNPGELLSALKELGDGELRRLGHFFKEFPFGCDINEILVDVAGSNQSLEEIKGGIRILDRLGLPVHVCSYAVADVAEREGKTPYQLLEELRRLTDMPIDADHFGRFGPMRYPEEIVKCPADCYRSGKPFNGCPRGRIHRRLIEKEMAFADEVELWPEAVQSISVSFMSFQKETSHSADVDETLYVVNFAKERGKGVGAIICVGNGEDELIKGVEACLKYGIDEIVLEGGPYNCAPDRRRAFGEGVVLLRILAPGKVVATNGQYEDELIFGLECGLNSVISGFPGNHHAYMSGYKPGEASVNKFGLPKVWEIMAETVKDSYFPVPADRETAVVIAKSARFLGRENIYPSGKVGDIFIGDAHWFLLLNSPLAEKLNLKLTLEELIDTVVTRSIKTVGLIGGRFLAWGVARALSPFVERFYVSDRDLRVERITVDYLSKNLPAEFVGCGGDDEVCMRKAELPVVCSFIPALNRKFEGTGALTLA